MDFMCAELQCGPYEVFGQQVARDGCVTYCLNQNSPGPLKKQWTTFDKGWEWVNDARAAIAHNGYPVTTTIGGHQLSEGAARAATQLALWMHMGTTTADGIHKSENFGGSAEKEEILAAARWLNEKASSGEITAPRNRTRMYYAITHPNKGVPTQNLLYVMPTVDVAFSKTTGDASITEGNDRYSVAGAEFDIYDATDTKVGSIKTDENGKASLKLGPNSTYYAVETKAPKGFCLSSERTAFTTGDTGGSAVLTDAPKSGTVTVTKKDASGSASAQAGATFKGAEFEAVSKSAPGWSQKATADASGRATFKRVPLGEVEIREVKAPEGYLISNATQTVEIKADSSDTAKLSLAFEETPIAFNLEISKFKADSSSEGSKVEQAGAGIKFEVISNTTGKAVATITTNAYGYADTESQKGAWFGTGKRPQNSAGALPYDRNGYTVHEVTSTVPSGFAHVTDWTIPASSQKNGAKLQFIVNNSDIRSRLQVVKIDADTGATVPMKGFSFKILDADGNAVTQESWYPNNVKLDTFTTDDSGAVTLPQSLRAGTYQLQEVKAQTPYLLNDQTVSFSIPSDPTVAPVCLVSLADTKVVGELEIVKKDAVNGKALAGAEFDIFACEDIEAPDGTVQALADELMGHVVCDDEGVASLKDLPLGKGKARYRIVETAAPKGYLLNSDDHEVTLAYRDASTPVVRETLEVTDDYTKVDISKKDATGKDEVPGAELTVKDSSGNEIDHWTSTDKPHRIEHLEPGTYTLTEVMTPRTYDQAESIEFTVEADGSVQTVVMKDEPIKVEGRIDKRQEIANPTAENTAANGDGKNRADANGKEDGSYSYTIDFENTSSTWVDEFVVEDMLNCACDGLATLQSIETPQASKDYDGLLNVWYLTETSNTKTGKEKKTGETSDAAGENDQEESEESLANATVDDGHENPWLDDNSTAEILGSDKRVTDYSSWKLWARDLSATESTKLDASKLKLDEDEKIIGIRFEYGRAEAGFTTRKNSSKLWQRDNLLDKHDDVLKASDVIEDASNDEADFAYRPAVVNMKVTDEYRGDASLENIARVHLYRNGGGDNLEDHAEDKVVQTVKEVPVPYLEPDGNSEQSPKDVTEGEKLLQTGGTDARLIIPAAITTVGGAAAWFAFSRKRF